MWLGCLLDLVLLWLRLSLLLDLGLLQSLWLGCLLDLVLLWLRLSLLLYLLQSLWLDLCLLRRRLREGCARLLDRGGRR